MRARHRLGFTLIELLIVIGIIAVLLGLALGAVQQVRGAAARMQCSDNMRQLGLAAHHFHDVKHQLPSGMYWDKGKSPYRLSSWITHLLPYLDQVPLWNLTEQAYKATNQPRNNPPHVGQSTVLAVLVCPADGRGFQVQFAPRDQISVALTSYLGVSGKDLRSKDGIFYRDSTVRMADITDGASHTLMIGERPPSTDFQFGWWYAGAGQHFTGSGDMLLGVEEQNVLPITKNSCPPGTYTFEPGSLTNQCDMFHFWSLHPGGAHFVFADGSVHFLTYASAPLLPALASRAGGEIVSLEF